MIIVNSTSEAMTSLTLLMKGEFDNMFQSHPVDGERNITHPNTIIMNIISQAKKRLNDFISLRIPRN